MEHAIQEAITDYINKFVLLEPDTNKLRTKIVNDIMKMSSVKEVIISEAMPIEFIKVIDVDENVGMWTITRTLGQ
jgi:RNA:NAD 2'-phosphotransferase (TPT1/KptA family)